MATRQQPAPAWLDGLAHDDEPLVARFRYGTVAPGTSLRSPGGSEHLVLLLDAGTCRGHVAGHGITLTAGDALWLPPYAPARLDVPDGVSAFRLRLRGDTAPDRVVPYLLVRYAWELRFLFDAAVRESSSGGEFAALRCRSLLVAALSAMLRTPSPATGALTDRQVTAIREYVEAHLLRRPTVRDLAGVAGLSEDAFARRFRRTFGQPPRTWLVRRRIQAAAQRLDETDDSVGAVAAYYGYSDMFFFSRQFKAVMGVPPRAWRQRQPARTIAPTGTRPAPAGPTGVLPTPDRVGRSGTCLAEPETRSAGLDLGNPVLDQEPL